MAACNAQVLLQFLAPIDGNSLSFAVHYGSQAGGGDIDMLAVYQCPTKRSDYCIGRIDVLALTCVQLRTCLGLHDPLVSEPLLTGSLLYGDAEEWGSIRDEYCESRPGSESLFSLRMRAAVLLDQASGYCQGYEQMRYEVTARRFWQDLSFGLSHVMFADEYARGRFPLTFAELLREDQQLAKAVQFSKGISGDGEWLDPAMMRNELGLAKARSLGARMK